MEFGLFANKGALLVAFDTGKTERIPGNICCRESYSFTPIQNKMSVVGEILDDSLSKCFLCKRCTREESEVTSKMKKKIACRYM